MVIYRKASSTLRCTSSTAKTGNQSGGGTYFSGLTVRFYNPADMSQEELPTDWMYEQTGFAPLNWNDVYHQKAEGYVWSNVHVIGKSLNPTKPVLDSGSYGSYGFAGLINGQAALAYDDIGFIVRRKGNDWYVGYVGNRLIPYISKGNQDYRLVYLYGNCFITKQYNRVKKKYMWTSVKASYRLVSPSPPGWYDDGPSAVAASMAHVRATLASFNWSRTDAPAISSLASAKFAYYGVDIFDSLVSPEMVMDYLRHNSSYMKNLAFEWFSTIEPELHATSFDSIEKFDGNMLVLLSKMNDFGRVTLGSFWELFRSSGSVKDFASFWLANRYGDRLSIGGFSDLVKSLSDQFLTIQTKTSRFIRGKSRKSDTVSDGYISVSVRACSDLAITPKDSNALMRLIRSAYEWDFYPSLGNVWDAIPLSFVVDWFVNVGDIYKSVDRMVQARYYDVQAILQSLKAEAVDPLFPTVTHTFYRREVGHSLRLGVDSVKLGLPGLINIIDGAALFCG